MAKKITLCLLVLTSLVGLVMMFVTSVDMARFTIFCTSIAPLYISLITSIGLNSASEKIFTYKEKVEGNE